MPRQLPIVRLSRSLAVSVITTLWSAALLGVLSHQHVMAAGWANIVATLAGIGPSYMLNRRWAWGRTGRSDIAREIAPFVGMCLLSLTVSTGAVWLADRWAQSVALGETLRTLVLLTASGGSFAALWCAQFLLLHTLFTSPWRTS